MKNTVIMKDLVLKLKYSVFQAENKYSAHSYIH